MTNVVPLHSLQRKFATSYSRLKNFETCPRRYHEIDVEKNFKEAPSDSLDWGNFVHEAFEKRLAHRKPLPTTVARYEDEMQSIERAAEGGQMRVELKLAFDSQFRPTGYFDKGTWFRGKADVLLLHQPNAWAIDWKTGAVKEDFSQLALMAQCVLSNYPDVESVGATFVWLGAGEGGANLYTTELYDAARMTREWNNLWPRFQLLEQAHETGNFPPKESGLCKRYCAVTSCKYNGRR